MFSSRTPTHFEPNRLTGALARVRAAGRELIDLTITNPTQAGIAYPAGMLEPMARAAALDYAPEPFGMRDARRAVSADYARRGVAIDSGRIVLTASTSEAYSLLFKLLCNPEGDRVLVPVPSYPLFDHLTRLEGVEAAPYRLEYHGRWSVDGESVSEAWGPDVRAVLAVSPNNPTGSVVADAELRELELLCASGGAALVVDEVFADYPLGASADPARQPPALRSPECLTFRLGGLSKSAGLPQVKLGWIAVEGPDALVAGALERLELICDTYLSVSTPVQIAAAELIRDGALVRAQILERVRGNYDTFRELAAQRPSVEALPADAGWSAILRVPSTRTEEEMALELLNEAGVLVHPGFFFDFPHEAFLVVSLLPPTRVFRSGLARVLEHVHD